MAERSGVAERVCELTEQLLGSLVYKDSASLKHPATLERRHSNQQHAVTRSFPRAAVEGKLTKK
jgi:hypothetical protein